MLKTLIIFFIQSYVAFSQNLGEEGFGGVSFKLHKENYFFPYYTTSPVPRGAVDKEEFKYQFSIKLTPFIFGAGELSFAFTQKAFWQLYDKKNSRPFRETNYNPEIFYRYKLKPMSYDFGFEHESNGKSDPISRSWDRVFFRLNLLTGDFRMSYKLWLVTDEESYGPMESERPQKIADFYGNQELEFAFYLRGTIIKSTGRYNTSTEKGFIESKILWPITKKILWGFNYSNGYGDSLRSYNLNHSTFGVGILVNP